jgi:arylsulfatase A-like enzyme
MMPLLTGDTDAHREYAYSGLGGWRLAYDGRYKLVTGFDPEGSDIGGVMDLDADPVLFDRETDPFETTDVADGHPEVVERLHDHVETHRTESGLIDNYYT